MEVAIFFGIIILACLLIALSKINAHVKDITADIAEKIIAEKNIKNIRKQKLNKIYKKDCGHKHKNIENL